jgi:Flp pilus assembly pilin Flp
MSTLINFVRSFRHSDEGQDLLEYALLVALIAIVAAGAVGLAGEAVEQTFNDIAAAI